MDQCFASDLNHKLIQHLYPAHEFQVNVSTFHVKNVQNYNLCLEKLENMIQLRITDVLSAHRMFICTIGELIKYNRCIINEYNKFLELPVEKLIFLFWILKFKSMITRQLQ